MAIEPPALPQNLLMGLFRLADALQKHELPYALIGGLASGYRSRPRFTRDIDLLLHVPQLKLPGLLEDLHRQEFEFDLATVIRQWNQEHMTLLRFRGVIVDWLKPILPLYAHVIDLAEEQEWLGHHIRVATVEGLILTKLIAFRRQDQLDIENLLAANRGQLDVDYIRREWQSVAEIGDPRTAEFEQMVQQLYLRTDENDRGSRDAREGS